MSPSLPWASLLVCKGAKKLAAERDQLVKGGFAFWFLDQTQHEAVMIPPSCGTGASATATEAS